MMCASCSGTGTVRCSSCNGRGQTQRLTISGDMDISPCLACAGRGQVPCQFCGGRGVIGSSQPSAPPARKRGLASDKLEGRWNGPSGNWYEFVREGENYGVKEGSPLGQTGHGSAKLKADLVKLNIENSSLGKYSFELRLIGDRLEGQLQIMGMVMPISLNRG